MGEESISLMVIRITVGISSDEDRTVVHGFGFLEESVKKTEG